MVRPQKSILFFLFAPNKKPGPNLNDRREEEF
jgi:hypothetical protein